MQSEEKREHATHPTQPLSLEEELCRHLHADAVAVRRLTEQLRHAIERNKTWLARHQ